MKFSHVYDLAGSVEGWERIIRSRLEGAVESGMVVDVDVDETTGCAEATLHGATSDDLDAIDDALVYETVTRNPRVPDETWVSLGCVVKA
jgi:hypothetical protein